MGREILGLNQLETAEVPDVPETQRERPDFAEIGAARLARAKDRMVGFKDSIKKGMFGFLKRVAATPEMASHAAEVMNEKVMDVHTRAGDMKESIVDAIDNKIIAGGEFVGRQYETVSTAAVNGYRSLETRSVAAYTNFTERVDAAKKAMRDRKVEKEYQDAKKALAEAQARFSQAQLARGQAAR